MTRMFTEAMEDEIARDFDIRRNVSLKQLLKKYGAKSPVTLYRAAQRARKRRVAGHT